MVLMLAGWSGSCPIRPRASTGRNRGPVRMPANPSSMIQSNSPGSGIGEDEALASAMSHIITLDRSNVRGLVTEIQTAVDAVLASHGMSNARVSGTFTANELNVRFAASTVSINAETGVNESSAEATDYLRFGSLLGLPAGLLGSTFRHQCVDYTFLGTNRHASRFPVLARRADGKVFKFPVAAVVAVTGSGSSGPIG